MIMGCAPGNGDVSTAGTLRGPYVTGCSQQEEKKNEKKKIIALCCGDLKGEILLKF